MALVTDYTVSFDNFNSDAVILCFHVFFVCLFFESTIGDQV